MPACFACGSEELEADDGELMCLECGEVQPPSDEAGADTASGFKVGQVLQLAKVPGKDKLAKLSVDIGSGSPVQVVTNAGNVKEGDRIVIATVGTLIGDADDGEVVKKTTVGGVASNGMVCDGSMLGWGPGNKGRAATLPESFSVGGPPPSTKPRDK